MARVLPLSIQAGEMAGYAVLEPLQFLSFSCSYSSLFNFVWFVLGEELVSLGGVSLYFLGGAADAAKFVLESHYLSLVTSSIHV